MRLSFTFIKITAFQHNYKVYMEPTRRIFQLHKFTYIIHTLTLTLTLFVDVYKMLRLLVDSDKDRTLASSLSFHIIRAAKHMFSNPNLLRSLLLRLCQAVKPAVVTESCSSSSDSSQSETVGGEQPEATLSSTPQKKESGNSRNLDSKQVCSKIISSSGVS